MNFGSNVEIKSVITKKEVEQNKYVIMLHTISPHKISKIRKKAFQCVYNKEPLTRFNLFGHFISRYIPIFCCFFLNVPNDPSSFGYKHHLRTHKHAFKHPDQNTTPKTKEYTPF